LVFNVKGVEKLAETDPTGAGVEDGTDVIDGNENDVPGNTEPSTIVPLAFSITLQSVIEPVVVTGGVDVEFEFELLFVFVFVLEFEFEFEFELLEVLLDVDVELEVEVDDESA
jgi:hypothetical protein